LSNDKCNFSSPLIHIAPIISREYDPRRWYCVPFKSIGDRNCVIDISNIMLVDKEVCSRSAYSESISGCIVNNDILFDNIRIAIMRQFQLNITDMSYPNEYKIDTTHISGNMNNRQQPISITINLNGIPLNTNTNVSDVISATNNDVNIDISKLTTNAGTTESNVCADNNTIVDSVESASSSNDVETNTTKKSNNYHRLNNEEQKKLIKFIRINANCFGGNMTITSIAEKFNISSATITKYVKKAKESYNKRASLPKEMWREFLEDYVNHGTKYCIDKYNDYGFNNEAQIYRAVSRYKKEVVTA
jgi:Trp operon repressor